MSGNKYTVAAVALLAVGTLFVESPAVAQVSISGYTLPMNIALDGALEAVRACTAKGYAVTATVVDVAGTPEVVLRGDHAVIQTKDSSYRKAYTAVFDGADFPLRSHQPILGCSREVSADWRAIAGIDPECHGLAGWCGNQAAG